MPRNLTSRRSKTRHEMGAILSGGTPGQLCILDIRDCLGDFNGSGAVGYHTWRDWVEACHAIGSDANVIVGEKEYFPQDHPLGWRRELVWEKPGERCFKRIVPSPLKPLEQHYWETDVNRAALTNVPIETEEDFDALIAYLRMLRGSCGQMVESLRAIRREVGDGGFLTVFVSSPMEAYYVVMQHEMVLHSLMMPEKYGEVMAEVERTSYFVIECAAEAGADMIMFGGAGTEIFSPDMIGEHIVRPEAGYAEACRDLGLFSLMHCCGRTQVLRRNAWIADVSPTVFESFTPEPLGDIADPVAAARELPAGTFFKGGLSLERLLRGTPQECAAMTREALAAFAGVPHIVSGTCAILTGTPRENLDAVTGAVAEHGADRT